MNRRNFIRAIGGTAAATTTAITAGCLDDASDVVSSATGQSNVPEYSIMRTDSNSKFTTIESEELFIEQGDENENDELVFEVVLDVVEEHEDLHSNCIGFEFVYTAYDEEGVVIDEQDRSSSFITREALSLGNSHRKTLGFGFNGDEIDEIEEIEIGLVTPEDTMCI